ncbi:hypothetical protein NKH77_19145 [Streptomyces sp. M19]
MSTAAADDRLPQAAGALHRGLATEDFGLVARAAEALTHGYTAAFTAAACMFLAGLVVTVLAINAERQGQGPGPGPDRDLARGDEADAPGQAEGAAAAHLS